MVVVEMALIEGRVVVKEKTKRTKVDRYDVQTENRSPRQHMQVARPSVQTIFVTPVLCPCASAGDSGSFPLLGRERWLSNGSSGG